MTKLFIYHDHDHDHTETWLHTLIPIAKPKGFGVEFCSLIFESSSIQKANLT